MWWLEPNEVFSSVSGWISVACWTIVLMPQLYTNYKRKSSDALSLMFVVTWLAGDLLNLAGSVLQGLLKTMIILAIYYILADLVLIWQVFYYRNRTPVTELVMDENTPLVQHTTSEKPRRFAEFVETLLQLFLVCLTGTGAYLLSGHGREHTDESDAPQFLLLPQVLGWASALLYLGSRIPQIHKNYKNKSCEGLALSMFAFAVIGNVTYCMAIVFHSTNPDYLLVNLPWMIGSAGTMFLDFVIFLQFYIYSADYNNNNNIETISRSQQKMLNSNV